MKRRCRCGKFMRLMSKVTWTTGYYSSATAQHQCTSCGAIKGGHNVNFTSVLVFTR